MKHLKFKKNTSLVVTVLFNVGLCVAIVLLMRSISHMLNSDVQINLMEIVTQNKDVISSRLDVELSSLKNLSDKMTDLLGETPATAEDFSQLTFQFAPKEDSYTLWISDKNGVAQLADGRELDISGRKYFRLSQKGTPNISEPLLSRLDGSHIYVASVPLYQNGEVIGSVQRSYTEEQFYELCALTMYSSQGYVYIIDSQGYVMVHGSHEGCQQVTENYYRDLYSMGNTQTTEKMQADLKAGKNGFIETGIRGRKVFSAYTPLENLHEWYLITSVPVDAVSPNGSKVIVIFYCILFVTAVIFSSCLLYFGRFKDKQKRALEDIAFRDPITGGNTYSKFVVEAKRLLQANPLREYWVIKFDIDNFKYINNYYGFEYGDQILGQIYHSLTSALIEGEVVGRESGDHFIGLLRDVTRQRVEELFYMIQRACNISIYFSAGLYRVEDKEENLFLMVDKAGTAARTVKGNLSQNVGVYAKEFDHRNMRSEELKRAVSQAILHNEFEAFYQPKVDIATGELVGAEALVRWRTKEGKLVSPGEFIPMCEKTGIVVEIDMLILEKVVQFLRRQLDAGVECTPISVNFSRLHLLDDAFFQQVLTLVNKYNVPPGLVELELTESAIFDNQDTIFEFTQRLHGHGFLVAMDDFGSGYSSLNMLKDVPIDTLKIDRGFLSETINNERRKIIFSTVAHMAQRLGMHLVVEGVEYAEHLELMQECGCRVAQGYYYSKPVEESAFEVMFREKKV